MSENGSVATTHAFIRPSGRETVDYDPADESFTFTITNVIGYPEYTQTFRAADIVANETTDHETVYERGGDRLVLSKPRSSVFETGYVTLASWASDDGATLNSNPISNEYGFTVFGYQTYFHEMPNSGTASYQLSIRGRYSLGAVQSELTGDGLLTADFASSTVQARFNLKTFDQNGQPNWLRSFSGPGLISAGPIEGASNLFYGIGSPGGSGIGVFYTGAFYGPDAAEVGGTLYVNGSHTGERVVAGFVGATRDTTTPRPGVNDTLLNLDLSETFAASSFNLAFHGSSSPGTAGAGHEKALPQTVTYNAETDSFIVPTDSDTIGGSLSLVRAQTLTPEDLDAGASGPDRRVYRVDDSAAHPRQRVTLYTPGASPYALSYVAIGVWEDLLSLPYDPNSSYGRSALKYFVYGIRTRSGFDPLSQQPLPTSGDGTYAINAVGSRFYNDVVSDLSGDGAVTAHFDSGDFDINLDLYDHRAGGAPALWHTFSATNAGMIITDPGNSDATNDTSWYGYGERGVTFTIDAMATDDPLLEAKIVGNFFGPNAVEIGAGFTISNSTRDDVAVGAFVGVKQP